MRLRRVCVRVCTCACGGGGGGGGRKGHAGRMVAGRSHLGRVPDGEKQCPCFLEAVPSVVNDLWVGCGKRAAGSSSSGQRNHTAHLSAGAARRTPGLSTEQATPPLCHPQPPTITNTAPLIATHRHKHFHVKAAPVTAVRGLDLYVRPAGDTGGWGGRGPKAGRAQGPSHGVQVTPGQGRGLCDTQHVTHGTRRVVPNSWARLETDEPSRGNRRGAPQRQQQGLCVCVFVCVRVRVDMGRGVAL
jgi:hypothetical protein